MMKKTLFLILSCIIGLTTSLAQENHINRIPETGFDPEQKQYNTFEKGFWIAAEALGGPSLHLKGHNMGFVEVDVAAGYRFNQFFKVGLGLGGRYYIDQSYLRRSSIKWGMPIFATVRGNIISGTYRKVVPYWGVEAGASIRDGAFFRPSIGLSIGEFRNAFTITLSYMGQNIATLNEAGDKAGKYTSFVALRLGYEF